MKATAIGICFGLTCYVACGAASAFELTLEDCVASYAEKEGGFGELKVAVSSAQPKDLPQGHVVESKSPQGSGTLASYTFDSMQVGVGRVVVAIYPRVGRKTYLSFDPARSVSAHWLNERLVYIDAWWGRIAASEMVFDSLEGRFIYRKLANYGYKVDPKCAELEK